MRDYFAYYWAVVRDLFNPERIPFEDLIEEPPIFRTEEADRGYGEPLPVRTSDGSGS